MSLYWIALQRIHEADLAAYAVAARAQDLDCPVDVFEQLFFDHAQDPNMAEALRFVDWNEVIWEEGALSGIALRHAAVPRGFQHAVDTVRQETVRDGFSDERPEVTEHWNQSRTWIRAPIALAGDLLGSTVRYEFIVGFTRLGKLLGVLDRQDLPEHSTHRVWIGRKA